MSAILSPSGSAEQLRNATISVLTEPVPPQQRLKYQGGRDLGCLLDDSHLRGRGRPQDQEPIIVAFPPRFSAERADPVPARLHGETYGL